MYLPHHGDGHSLVSRYSLACAPTTRSHSTDPHWRKIDTEALDNKVIQATGMQLQAGYG